MEFRLLTKQGGLDLKEALGLVISIEVEASR